MAEEGVFMDTEAVQGMANQFGNFGDILSGVDSALQAAMNILKVTALVGLVGGFAVEQFLAQIEPIVKQMAEKCKELKLDLIGAVVSYRDGDDTGSQKFAH